MGQEDADTPGADEGRLEAVRIVASLLLGDLDWEETLPRALAGVGRAIEASRCCVYRYERALRGGPGARLFGQWASPGPAAKRQVEDVVWVDPVFSGLSEALERSEVFRTEGDDLAGAFDAHGLVAVRVSVGDERWGFLLAVFSENAWGENAEEVSLLRTTAGLVGAAAMRRREAGESVLRSMAVECAGEAIILTDSVGRIRYVNRGFEQITGYERDEVAGESIRLLESGEHPPEFYAEVWDALGNGRGWSGRMVNRRKDGTLYRQDTSIVPVRDSRGEMRNFVSVGRDVTQRMALEAQLRRAQKLESLGLLASGIAHDFNNVMGLVLGAAERLKALGPDSERAGEYIGIILDAVSRGQSVSRRMLAFYRDRETKSEVFDLAGLLEELAEIGSHTFPRNIEISVKKEARRSVVRGDRSQIHQALMNLCINGAAAMPEGGTLSLGCRTAQPGEPERHLKEPKGRYVCLTVGDTGTGMNAETLEKIFDPYFTTKSTGHGTGLGLPIVFAIVQAQGGWVHVESAPGEGSLFTVGMGASWEEPVEDRAGDDEEPAAGDGETVLVVDDEEGIRQLLRETLTAYGYEVVEADDGTTALAIFEERGSTIAAVVTDLGMAQMGGAELVRRIRTVSQDLPVVVTTGYIDPKLPERFKGLGVTDVLRKPFRMAELLGVLAKALSKTSSS